MASFWAELLVFIAAVKAFPIGGIAALVGLIISALFMLRVVQRTFYGDKNPRWEHIPDVPGFLAVPRIVLVSIILFFGYVSQDYARCYSEHGYSVCKSVLEAR